jgi:predicted RNase H-like HicB family nuclease
MSWYPLLTLIMEGLMPQRYTIQAVIYPGEENGYVAECLNLAVVTQGSTLDETVKNLREAIQLHLEGEDMTGLGLVQNPPLLVTMEMEPIYAQTS